LNRINDIKSESKNEYVDGSRNMLKTHIGINDKVEETQRLLEYIIMEEEKLEEAKRTFDEDCEKFNKYLDEVERKAAEATEQAEVSTKRKNLKANEIAQLTE
jgi:hypothetical protein